LRGSLSGCGMLGLADYDSPIGAEDSPAPVAQAPAPAGSQPPVLLSIVDYFDDDKPEEPAPPAGLAVSLDDEALQRAVPRMVGGVQISVVKKTPPRPADEGNGVLPGDAVASDSTAASGPEFKLPDSPSGSVDQKLLEKFASLVEQTKKGYSVNDHIRNAKSFRNPDILEKLVNYFEVREFGTNYPPALYDPTDLNKEEHYDRLEEARRKWEERQARKPGEKIAFASGGTIDGADSAKPRKSKWDSSQTGAAEQPAKRPQP